ncbi:hypothetical protein FSP39_001000 [Pinctada imbricata]|uniref:C2H2-type domain-containing protein n=1 Tax=Pinctada imbricata TaxID=66713 RepID=A0AA89BSV5_PINIB|nr:hypothetical protein FSP39_001000 [Pinctada imbricata]
METISNSLDASVQKEVKNNTFLECPSCYGMVQSEEEFLSHMESHGTTLANTCLHCQKEFHKDSELARHILLMHMKQKRIIRKRENANLKIVTTPSLNSQNDKYKFNLDDGPDAQYKCPNCQTVFKNIKCFAYHLNSYANNGRNHCGICHRFFTYKSNLTKHMKYTHSDLKNFICDVCGKSFKHNDSLKIHKKSHEEGRGSNLECMECGKLLSCTTALKVHMRRHTGSTPYMCEICGKAFKQSSNLQKHMLVHTTETLFKCEICAKEFKYQETYKNHMTAHILKSGKAEGTKTQFSKIYTCEYCGKQFSTGSQHKVHLRTHTNERPYKCKQCDKAFKEHGKLSRHMKIHGMDAKNRARHKANSSHGGSVSKKSAISYNEAILTQRPEDPAQCVIMENPSSASVPTPQTISIPTPQAVTVPHDHTHIVPLPPQTDVSMSVIQGMEGQAPDSDTGTVLLQMMPSSQYQHYVSPPPHIQVPHPQGPPDSAHAGGYEVQQYFRSFTFQNTSMEGHPL